MPLRPIIGSCPACCHGQDMTLSVLIASKPEKLRRQSYLPAQLSSRQCDCRTAPQESRSLSRMAKNQLVEDRRLRFPISGDTLTSIITHSSMLVTSDIAIFDSIIKQLHPTDFSSVEQRSRLEFRAAAYAISVFSA